jgi:predicted ester cyclase
MDDPEKLERNKRFIIRYGMELETSDSPEQTMRTFTDNEDYIRTVITFRNAFPDYSIYIEHLTAEGDYVIMHGILSGTHIGEIFGIPATHRKVEFPIMVKYHILGEKIIHAWPMVDQMELFEQLGVLNKPV